MQAITHNFAGHTVTETPASRGWITLDDGISPIKVRKAQLDELVELFHVEPEPEPELEEDEDEGELTIGQQMARTLAMHRAHYDKVQTKSGRKTQISGDNLSYRLLNLTPGDVALIADRLLDQEDGFHQAKYAHLNPGQIRMNSGNRIRAHLKKNPDDLELVVNLIEAITEQVEAQTAE